MLSRVLSTLTSLLLFSSCILVDEFGEVQYTTYQSTEPSNGEQRIRADIDLGVGEVQIESGATTQAYQLDLEYNELAFKPDLDYSVDSDGNGSLRFRLRGEGSVRRAGKNQLNLRLNPEATLDLKANLGVGESNIDLTGLKVEALDVQSGVGKTSVTVLAPNRVRCRRVRLQTGVGGMEATGLGNLNFDRLNFEGGVGGAQLDFSGEWQDVGEVTIEVGIGGVEIELPREIGAEIRASESFLSGTSFSGFSKQGGVYRSKNIDKVGKVIQLRIEAGIGGVSVSWR